MPITTGSAPKALAGGGMDDDVQLAAYHPGNDQRAFPTPMPPPEPKATDDPAQKLRNAVGGLFFMKPVQPGRK